MNSDDAEAPRQNDDQAGVWSDHFDRSIRTESTRAKVVLSACYLDELLGQLIALLLKPCDEKSDPLLDGANAPFGTFSAKIELVNRLGVIDNKTKRSLHLARKIRNKFAHELSGCDFDYAAIRDWNNELHQLNDHATESWRKIFSDGPVGNFEKSVSWLVYWLRHVTQKVPTNCPGCGSEMEHRAKLKSSRPGEHG